VLWGIVELHCALFFLDAFWVLLGGLVCGFICFNYLRVSIGGWLCLEVIFVGFMREVCPFCVIWNNDGRFGSGATVGALSG